MFLSSIRYLAWQGLPVRGDGDEQDGNFLQLLKLKGEEDPMMVDWFEWKANKYTLHQHQNDILKIMAMHVLREVASHLQQSPYIAITMDETMDVSKISDYLLVGVRGFE